MFRFLICLIGLAFIWKRLRSLVLYLINQTYGRVRNLASIYGTGSYVLITGGSEGIGKAFANEFAARGFNLLLVARNPEKLDKTKQEILKVHPNTKIINVPFDFEKITDPENFDFIKAAKLDASGIDISIVVNNVGMSQGDFYENLDEERIKKVIKVNMGSQVVLALNFSHIWNKKNRRNAFIQTGSVSSINPLPYYDLYGATKSFNHYFTHALSGFDSNFIDYYLFDPSYVSTKLNNYRKGVLVVSPEESAAAAMLNVGSYRWEFNGHWKHELLAGLLGLIPDALLRNKFVRKRLYAVKKKGYSMN